MAITILEYNKNKTIIVKENESEDINFNSIGGYIFSKLGANVTIYAGYLPTTYFKTVNNEDVTYNYTYNKIIYTVTEQKGKYTITQRVYNLEINNDSNVINEILQSDIEPVVYKNLTQKQFDNLNKTLENSLNIGENIFYERCMDPADTAAEKPETASNLFDFNEQSEKKGSITLINYFSIEQDLIKINGTSVKTLLEETNGIGKLGDVNAIKSLNINSGTFLNETITGGESNDNLHGTKGSNTFQIVKEHAINGDIIYDSSANDNIVFGELDSNGIFHGDTDLENLTFKKLGNDLIITKPANTKQNDKVTVSDYFDTDTPSVNVNSNTINTDTLILTVEGNFKKSNTLTGTDFSDNILGGKKTDKITTGKGNDTIYANKGNDTITIDESGVKILKFDKGDGNDTVIISNDSAAINIDYNFSSDYETDLVYSKSGNDLVITRQYTQNIVTKDDGKITLQNYFDETGEITVTNTIKYKNENISDQINTKHLNITGKTSKQNNLTGTKYSDNIIGGKKADTITTGNGTDYITAGKGNDTITINGNGTKTIKYNKGDGNDTIKFTNSTSSVNLIYESGVKNVIRNEYTYSKSDNDLVITRYYVTKNSKGQEIKKADGTTTISDYFKDNGTVNVNNKIYLDNSSTEIDISNLNISVTDGVYDPEIKTTTYTGTSTKDIFTYDGKKSAAYEDSNITDDEYNITIKKGKSDLTIDDAGGNDVMNITNNISDLRIIFNVDKDGNVVKYTDEDNNSYYSLLIFNKNNVNYKSFKNATGFTEIFDYFKDIPEESTAHYATGTGLIETINTKDLNSVDMDNWINYVAGEVSKWLTDKTSMEVLNSDNKSEIQSLLQVFLNASYQQ